jgi:hypothetical protein
VLHISHVKKLGEIMGALKGLTVAFLLAYPVMLIGNEMRFHHAVHNFLLVWTGIGLEILYRIGI